MKKPPRRLLKRRSPYTLSLSHNIRPQFSYKKATYQIVCYFVLWNLACRNDGFHWNVLGSFRNKHEDERAMLTRCADCWCTVRYHRQKHDTYMWLQELGVVTDDMYWTTFISCTWIFLSITTRRQLFILPYFLIFRTTKEYTFSFGKY
jgi:hypothetical protein